jgi:hypothetical protein
VLFWDVSQKATDIQGAKVRKGGAT